MNLYPLFFAGLSGFSIWQVTVHSGGMAIFWVWLTINMGIMTLAYSLNYPGLLLGKTSSGKINPFCLLINLPWLLLTWLIFQIQAKCSHEEFCHQLADTRYWLSRRPLGRDALSRFSLVIDLTAEFPLDSHVPHRICIPCLDGHSLPALPMLDLPPAGQILIHCANGHGRSALLAASLLIQDGTCPTIQEAFELIERSRPGAVPNTYQKRHALPVTRLQN